MTGMFIQVGQYTIPTSSVSHVDAEYERTQAEGGGKCVRVWLNSQGYPNPTQQQPPQFLDFRGQQAQQIRRNIRNLGTTGNLTVFLGSEEGGETTDAPRAKAAAAKS